MQSTKDILSRRIRLCIWIITGGLFLSGITAFPLETELQWLNDVSSADGFFHNWLSVVYHAVQQVNQHYPYLSYGTDWLALHT